MREWYEFNRDAIRAIIDNPIEAIKSIIFLSIVGILLYMALWIGCPC